MLNTMYHTKEEVMEAIRIVNDEVIFDAGTTESDKEAYESILIFCNFDKEKASKYYGKLLKNGFLFQSDVVLGGSDLVGWAL